MLLDRALATRVLEALKGTLTGSGHLAMKNTREHRGLCGWRTESPRCAEQRALIAALAAALEEER